MPWKKICCAVDFSECSHAALDEAATLAGREGAALVLLHVYPPPRPPGPEAPLAWSPSDLEAETLGELEGPMARLRADAEAIAGAGRVETRLLAGKPADEIARFARDGGCDLVVIGTHGRTGVRRLVLGSVAEQVVRAAPVSVLVSRAGPCYELPGAD